MSLPRLIAELHYKRKRNYCAGPDVVKRMRADLLATFGDGFLDYIYHCNVQKPT